MKSAPPMRVPAPPCVVRRAAEEDAPVIEALYRELVADGHIHVLPSHIAALAESSSSFLLVAEVEGIVYATTLLTLCPDVMYGTQPFGVIENIIVTQRKRGSGLGRHLLQRVEQIATQHNCSKLMLLSSRARREAHAFFQRCGFNGESKRAFVKYRRQFAEQMTSRAR